MRLFLALLISLLLMAVAAACTTPPPTEEQLRAYAQYAELRATDAAASELIAAAKATEAAAVQQIAQATAAALPTPAVVTVTATLTPSLVLTTTTPLTVTGDVVAATALLTTTGEITATATPTPTAIVTATVAPTPTLRAQATVTMTPTTVVASAATPAATVLATSTPPPPTSPIESSPWAALLSGAAGQAITATLAAPTPTPAPAGQAIVTSQQANLRGGPGMAFDVQATARQGDALDVYGSDAAQNWWQVCCVDGKAGWVSRTIVRFQGDVQSVPVVGPLLPDDLNASWAMRWECKGRGCQQDVCTGQSQAAALRVVNDRWLEVQREATWDDGCGEPEDWLTQVDRYTGQERQTTANPPLFNIWQGANPGPANRSVELAGATLALWCSETRTQEVAQTGGWTAAFEGQACYDTRSGVLALMQYVKRWLFTGTTGGQTFDREYFGDYEVIQQVLLDTNAPLSGRDD
jgi:SH3-like domain-containing protein